MMLILSFFDWVSENLFSIDASLSILASLIAIIGPILGFAAWIIRMINKRNLQQQATSENESEVIIRHGRNNKTSKRLIISTLLCSALLLIVLFFVLFIWRNSFVYVDGVKIDKSVHELEINCNNIENVSALKNYDDLESLQIINVELSDEELTFLHTYLSERNIHCTVDLFGQSINYDVCHIDLSGNSNVSLHELEGLMKFFPDVLSVDMSGCGFSNEELWYIEQSTELDLVWEISLGGETFKTDVTELDLTGRGITDISDLKYCEKLTVLNLSPDRSGEQPTYNSISDITPLAKLTSLTRLGLTGNNISDITPLTELIHLTELGLGENNITDITPLSKMSDMTWLYLNENNISDVTPLAGMTKLNSLF